MADGTHETGSPKPGPARMYRLAGQVGWSDLSGSQLLVLQPHNGLNRLVVLTDDKVVLSGSDFLPSQPAAYSDLQDAMKDITAVPPLMAR